jgi:hypothetical protein
MPGEIGKSSKWVKGRLTGALWVRGAWHDLCNMKVRGQVRAPVGAGFAAGGLIEFVPFVGATTIKSGIQIQVGSAQDPGSIDHILGPACQLPAVR